MPDPDPASSGSVYFTKGFDTGTVLRLLFLSFRSEARNLIFYNLGTFLKDSSPRHIGVRNDIFCYYDTVSWAHRLCFLAFVDTVG